MGHTNAADAKRAGWFSRRHQTNEAHNEAKVHGPVPKENKRIEAEQRAEERAARTDAEQLKRLEDNGYKGCKEWIRLSVRVPENERL